MSGRTMQRRVLAAVAAVGVVMSGAVATAQQAAAHDVHAAAAKLTEKELTGVTRVKSSTGKALSLNLGAFESASGSAYLVVDLGGGPESHDWQFTVPHSAFVLNGNQSGSVRASDTTTHGYAAIDLKFTKHAATKTTSCSSANYQTQTAVAVTGTIQFDTKSSGSGAWGKVSVSRTKKSPLLASSLENYGTGAECVVFKEPCANANGWTLGGTGSTYVSGGSSGSKGYITASKMVKLGTYGTRYDSVYLTAPKPKKAGSGATATFTVTTGKGQASGSLTFSATSAPANSAQTCYANSTKSTENTAYFTADVAVHGFAVNEQVFGSFTIPTRYASFQTTAVG